MTNTTAQTATTPDASDEPLRIPSIDPSGRAADDPRVMFDRAAATAGVAIAAVTSATKDNPTPCDDWTADELARHLIAVMERTAGIGRGIHPDDLAFIVDPTPDLVRAWNAAVADAAEVWSDAELLGRDVVVPWATIPGAVMMSIYASELLVHAWDLATAIGVELAWDEADAAAAFEIVSFGIPAEPRGGDMPFSPVVPVAEDAPAIERLVAWMGRRP